jgi:hypothetical protein
MGTFIDFNAEKPSCIFTQDLTFHTEENVDIIYESPNGSLVFGYGTRLPSPNYYIQLSGDITIPKNTDLEDVLQTIKKI